MIVHYLKIPQRSGMANGQNTESKDTENRKSLARNSLCKRFYWTWFGAKKMSNFLDGSIKDTRIESTIQQHRSQNQKPTGRAFKQKRTTFFRSKTPFLDCNRSSNQNQNVEFSYLALVVSSLNE